jgi:hypothetical protein
VLPGRVAGGRVCGNCLQILASQPCAECGERRRVGGRDAAGRAWCSRCRGRALAAAADEQRRRLIIEAITDAGLGITEEVAGAALTAVARSRVSLRLLADHIARHPDALTIGPTSTLGPLDRLVAALAAAGAQVTTIHPLCERCGGRRRWHARTASGGLCSSCCARTHRAACAVCGKPRRADRHDRDGRPVCLACAEDARRAARLGELAELITAAVAAVCPATDPTVVSAILDGVAPDVPDRARLASLVRNGPGLGQPAHRQVRVARLVAELRGRGVTVAAALCEDCGGPAEPLVIDGPITRCGACDHAPCRGGCSSCGTGRMVLDDSGRCRHCRDRQEARCARCGATGPRTWMCESWLCQRLGSFAAALAAAARIDGGDAKIVRTWLRWQVLPRLRRRAETGAVMAHSLNNARRALRAVLALLKTIHREGRTLATLTQADVDRWFAQPTGTCWLARGFLAWARDRRHVPRTVTIPPAPPKLLRSALNHEERWAPPGLLT